METKGHNRATADSEDTLLTKKPIAEMQLLRNSLPKRRNHAAEYIPCFPCALAAEQGVTNVSDVSASVDEQAQLKPSSALVSVSVCTDATQHALTCGELGRASEGVHRRGSGDRVRTPAPGGGVIRGCSTHTDRKCYVQA